MLSREQRERMAAVCRGGYVAMRFASDPDIWPAFAAWAERTMPGQIWTEADRLCMAIDAPVLSKIGELADPE